MIAKLSYIVTSEHYDLQSLSRAWPTFRLVGLYPNKVKFLFPNLKELL